MFDSFLFKYLCYNIKPCFNANRVFMYLLLFNMDLSSFIQEPPQGNLKVISLYVLLVISCSVPLQNVANRVFFFCSLFNKPVVCIEAKNFIVMHVNKVFESVFSFHIKKIMTPNAAGA